MAKISTTPNFKDWRYVQKYIRIEHNKEVVNWFRTAGSIARQNLKNSILVYKKDTANQILVKIQFFAQYISKNEDLLALPLQFDTRKIPGTAQLAVIFRPTSKTNESGNYTLHIPHYSGNKSPKVSSHTKGNHWAKYTCKDKAAVLVYCSTKAEAIRVARELNRYVDSKYRDEEINPSVGYMEHEPNKIVKVKPHRADYFKQGKKYSTTPDWRYYFK